MIARILSRLKNSPDHEHEMSFNRLAFLSIIAAYTFWINPTVPREALISAAVFAAVSVGIVIHILIRPNQSTVRRIVAIFSDLVTASIQLHYVGETSSVLFLLYLWITFGNGFRFGVRFLYVAVAVSVVCFSIVIYTTPRWHDDIYLSATLLLSLISLPLYASTLIRKLSNAKAQAEAANRAKTLFLASVSHELRTPLSAIIGLSSLMAGTNLDAEQRGIIRTIGSAGDSLLRQINNLLSLSRIEAGKMPIEQTDFDLSEVLSTTRAMVLTQAQQKGLRLTMNIAAGTPLHIRGAKHHVEEILLNLLGNAIKFTASGHVSLAARSVLEDDQPFIRFMVSDTGIGIAPHARERIFDSFTQADETIINRFGGTGLGLSICRQLVEAMGGRIGVDSVEGQGSRFWFTIPLRTNAEPMPQAQLFKLAKPLLVCSDPDLARTVAPRITTEASVIIKPTLAEGSDWIRPGISGPVILFYCSDLPDDVLAAELATEDLPAPPILIRPNWSDSLSDDVLMHVTSSILPAEFTVDDARLASIAYISQTSLSQALRSGPTNIELPLSSHPLSILLADDNATNRLVISKILERGGHTVRCVSNGEDALNALEEESFGLIILDVNMPVMTGIEAAKLFRFMEPRGIHTPIFALTADVTPEIAAQALAAGMDICLTKPVQPAALLKAIEEHTGRYPASSLGANRAGLVTVPATQPTVVDEDLIMELDQLGGKDFVLSVVTEFFSDADHLIRELRTAAASGDSHRFRLEAHGLQSASANVGAKAVYDICVGWRGITSAELVRDGVAQVDRLESELHRTRDVLQMVMARDESGSRRSPARA